MRDTATDEKLFSESGSRQIRIAGMALPIEMAYLRILSKITSMLSGRNF